MVPPVTNLSIACMKGQNPESVYFYSKAHTGLERVRHACPLIQSLLCGLLNKHRTIISLSTDKALSEIAYFM